jgi:uncharacterized protein (DUF983 family)
MPASSKSSQPKSDKRSAITTLVRSILLRCPACGSASIIERPFHIKHHCTNCDSLFKREEGFFVGAILANVITTEFVILVVCAFGLSVVGSSFESMLRVLLLVALLFPLAFFHHSWSFWLAVDFFIEGLPRFDEDRLKRR